MARQAVVTLRRVLLASGPSILQTQVFDHYATHDGKTKAVMGPRLQGPGQGPPGDVHNLGRALDIILYSRKPPMFVAPFDEERDLGYGLVNIFLELRPSMKWATMIYDQKEWNSAGAVFPRKKDAYDDEMARIKFEHLTHIHIDWSDSNADNVDFEDELVSNLNSADY